MSRLQYSAESSLRSLLLVLIIFLVCGKLTVWGDHLIVNCCWIGNNCRTDGRKREPLNDVKRVGSNLRGLKLIDSSRALGGIGNLKFKIHYISNCLFYLSNELLLIK